MHHGLPVQLDPSSIPSYSFHGAHMDSTTQELGCLVTNVYHKARGQSLLG